MTGRRDLLRLAALGVVGVAVAACRNGDDTPAGADETGAIAAGPATTRTALRTATSLERTAAEVLDELIAGGWITDGGAALTIGAFAAHHREAADALNAATVEAGGSPALSGNAVVREAAIDPALAQVQDQDSAVRLALAVEELVAATHQRLVVQVGEPELRQDLMAVATAGARRVTALREELSETLVPGAFRSTEPAAGDDALLPDPSAADDDED